MEEIAKKWPKIAKKKEKIMEEIPTYQLLLNAIN